MGITGGSGPGLRILREHGGEIDLSSDPGKGLTLTIRLPVRNRRARMLEAGGRRQEAGGSATSKLT
jgi:signal transduction histidine kinase